MRFTPYNLLYFILGYCSICQLLFYAVKKCGTFLKVPREMVTGLYVAPSCHNYDLHNKVYVVVDWLDNYIGAVEMGELLGFRIGMKEIMIAA